MAPQLPIYVISLPGCLERRASASAELQRVGLTFQFFDAVDGRSAEPVGYDAHRRMKAVGHPLYPGEIGCYLSHLAVMRRFIAEGHRAAVVLEDDLRVSAGLPAVLRALERLRFDVVKLGTATLRQRRHRQIRRLTDQEDLVRTGNVMHGTVGYLISREAAQRFLAYSRTFYRPVDVALNRTWEHGIDVKAVSPWPVTHDVSFASTIEATRFERPRRAASHFLQRQWDSLAKRSLFWLTFLPDRLGSVRSD